MPPLHLTVKFTVKTMRHKLFCTCFKITIYKQIYNYEFCKLFSRKIDMFQDNIESNKILVILIGSFVSISEHVLVRVKLVHKGN